MDVAILGCGPAGLLVAHAVAQAGEVPYILSVRQKSEIPGSQHLQGFIPDITPEYPDSAVMFVRMGTKEGYADKVYGDPYHPCGWPNYDGVYKSWSVFKAYDKLWDMYQSHIVDKKITYQNLPDIIQDFDRVLSTIPHKYLCVKGHSFDGIPYWIQPRITPRDDQAREVVVFNGLPNDYWYRWSILGGKESLESTIPLDHSVTGHKAITNDCDCWPDIVRLGRWAKWHHGVLLHHAYAEAVEIMEGAKVGN